MVEIAIALAAAVSLVLAFQARMASIRAERYARKAYSKSYETERQLWHLEDSKRDDGVISHLLEITGVSKRG